MGSVIQNIKLAQIRTDGETQSRVEIDNDVVAEYSEALTDGAKLPPITVFFDGVDYWLADGFHRRHAHKNIGALDIEASIIDGTKKDARIFAFGANKSHGLRRSNADKKKSILGMLAEAPDWSDNKIAKHVGVDHKTVAAHRTSILGNSQDAVRAVERSGKTYEQNTANIGKKKADVVPAKKPVRALDFAPLPEDPMAANDDLAEARYAITELAEENEELRDRLAVEAMEANDEEKLLAQETITELRQRVHVLEQENDALKASRDTYMQKVSEMQRQVNLWRKKAEKVAA